jgi:hypothetical protein
MLKDKKIALQGLGPKRDTFDEQATYLTKVASTFQSLASSAIAANYSSNDVLQKHSTLKIATLLVGRNELLSNHFAQYGHKFQYNSKAPSKPTANQAPTPQDEESASDILEKQSAACISTRETTMTDSHPEIEDILTENESLTWPKEGVIYSWLSRMHKESRGLELGTFDPSLLTVVMNAQSERWETLAYGYLSDIIAYTHTFVVDLIQAICPDERVSRGLLSYLTDRLVQKYEKAMKQAKFILHVERSNTPLTMNHYFNDNLEKW